MKYLVEFLFNFAVVAALMFFGSTLFNIWPENERLGLSMAFALGSSLAGIAVSAVRNRKKR